MTTVPFNLQRLLREVDSLKAEQFPLPSHYVAGFDEHTRESYATLLAAMLLAGGEVSANASRLFTLLLTSLGLGSIQAWLFEQANQLDQNQLKQFLRIAETEKLGPCFVLDALILSRLDTPISEAQSLLLSELVALLQVPEKELPVLSYFASKVLGLPFDHELSEDSLVAVYCVLKDTNQRREMDLLRRSYDYDKQLVKRDEYIKGSIKYETVFNSGRGIEQNMLMLCSKIIELKVGNRTSGYFRLEAVSPVTGIIYNTLLPNNSKVSKNTLVAWVVPLPKTLQVWFDMLGIPSVSEQLITPSKVDEEIDALNVFNDPFGMPID